MRRAVRRGGDHRSPPLFTEHEYTFLARPRSGQPGYEFLEFFESTMNPYLAHRISDAIDEDLYVLARAAHICWPQI
jgi:hypothetical protein